VKRAGVSALLAAAAVLLLVLGAGAASGARGDDGIRAERSGAAEMRDVDFGTDVTECPQAGLRSSPHPLRRMERDKVEQLSSGGDDIRMNQDYSCFPQDEMSISVNPRDTRNVVGGANDYRLAWGSSGFYASTDRGNSWYDGIIPFPSLPSGDNLDGGGDPAVIHDRNGVAYWTDINFNRTDDTNGIWTSRSTNGGFTWTRPCVPLNPAPPATEASACGGAGDPRQPGDGTVTFNQDPTPGVLNGDADFDDKEYNDAGPRPAGVAARCYTPTTRTPIPVGSPGCPESRISPDRLYVTWTRFNKEGTAAFIMESHSDDYARSWSRAKVISGSAPFCAFGATGANACDDNQGSQPVVQPETGYVYVAFENFNTPDENQYLLVRSRDGGETWEGPFFVTPVFDVNYPRAGAAGGRPDCTARGQQSGRAVLTNSCFRLNARGAIVVDKRGGAYADDLYLVIADNRNGTRVSTNTDVTLFKSVDGGTTWRGPTRVNDDPSSQPANRTCTFTGANACPSGVHTGNDQFYPWIDISSRGDLVVGWQDRRLDRDSVASEWPTSRTRPGNYLLWFWGGNCDVDRPDSTECTAPSAGTITQPTAPINPTNAPFPEQTVFPFDNFGISDNPYNWDYAFRAGIFAGDYENVFVDENDRAWAMWTDARNGRSSRAQAGRNPACEQSDAFADVFSASGRASGQNHPRSTDELFLVTPCPGASDHRDGH
jgi:hypothetical protein